MEQLQPLYKWILLLLIASAFTSVRAQVIEETSFESQLCLSKEKFLDDCKPLSVTGKLYKASSKTIVFVTHNSAGVDERHYRYASYLQSLGYSALVIDHYKSRGLKDAQKDFVGVGKRGGNAHNMVIDLYYAANHFKQLGFQSFGYIGESMGGGVGVLLAKQEWQNHFQRISGINPIKFDAIAALYGNCNERYSYDKFLSSPVLLLAGEKDGDSLSKVCKEYANYANSLKANFEFKELMGQYHDFDAPFSLQTFTGKSENPSECVSNVTPTGITASLTGKNYPNTPDGWSAWKKDCIIKAPNNVAKYGNTGNPNTGFEEWGQFFKTTLK